MIRPYVGEHIYNISEDCRYKVRKYNTKTSSGMQLDNTHLICIYSAAYLLT